MKKLINQKEIEAVLNTVYNTNISAQAFDGLKQFFVKLPDATLEKSEPEVVTADTTKEVM